MQVQQELAKLKVGAPRRIAHGNFYVGSLSKSMDFYNQIAGFEETFRLNDRGAGFLSNGNTHHDLGLVEVSERTHDRGVMARQKGIMEIPEDYGQHPGLNHFAFEMNNEADLVTSYERATQAGVRMNLVEDRIVTRSLYFADPEGNGIEFTADMLSNWRDYRRPGAAIEQTEYIPGQTPPSTESFYAEDPDIRRVEGSGFHPRRFAHATLIAADFESMRRFYTEVLGFEEASAVAGDFSLLRGNYPGYSLALFSAADDRSPGVHHIAFELPDESDFEGVEERLDSLGVSIEGRIEHETKRAIFVRDPDDMLVQFYYEEPAFLSGFGELDSKTALYLS